MMSESKDSFVVYTDIKEIIDELDDKQVATLFRSMVEFRITGKAPKLTGTLKYIFIPIRQQMERDKEKWEQTRAARAESGRKGGIASGKSRNKANKANEANASSEKPLKLRVSRPVDNSNEANEAVNVNVNGNVTVTDTVTATTTTTSGGSSGSDDLFNIWKRMSPKDVDAIYDVYPESGGFLIDEVYADVKDKKKKVDNPVAYILGYAKNVGWDDNADHFEEVN
jgi:hypothetical protein